MATNLSYFIALMPVVMLFVAAWPLLLLPRIRPLLVSASGSCCIGIGSAVMAVLAGGMVSLPGAVAFAEDKDEPKVAQTAESVPEKAKQPLAEADPVIEAPLESVEIPPGRPAWVGSEPNLRGKVHKIAVASGPYATDAQARRALDKALVKATNEYIAEQLGSELASKLIRYDARTIHEHFAKDENKYHDVARYSDPVGWMHENFALLEFGPDFRNRLNSRWTKVRASSRLAQVGLVAGGALLLLGSVFGFFRLDNATRGYYTGRLQFMTAAAILAVVGGGAVVSQWIHWL